MWRTKLVVGLGSAILIGCESSGRLTPAQENVERQRIEDVIDEWSRHLNNAATDSALAYYVSSDAMVVLWPDGSRATGRQAVEDGIRSFYGGIRFMNFNPQNPSVVLLNANTAVVTFRHSTDLVLADTRRDPFSGSGTLVLVRNADDNMWRIHTQHISRRL